MSDPITDPPTCPRCKARKPTNFSHYDPCPECGFKPVHHYEFVQRDPGIGPKLNLFNLPLTIPVEDEQGSVHVFEGCYVKSVECNYPADSPIVVEKVEPEVRMSQQDDLLEQVKEEMRKTKTDVCTRQLRGDAHAHELATSWVRLWGLLFPTPTEDKPEDPK